MLQVFETLHLMCIYLFFLHISLQILNCIYKKFKNGKIPYAFLPSLFTCFIKIFEIFTEYSTAIHNHF
jgi:hypothetical protein